MQELLEKIEKRRTFAIISHPDAGKTTLTEKIVAIWRGYSSSRISKSAKK